MKPYISLGFSPCPNDTFIFDAMVHFKVPTEGMCFKPFIHDVEELNHKAGKAELHITKISFFAYASVYKDYQLLDAGSALGFGCGPLLVSNKKFDAQNISSLKIAIPGIQTTANFLMSFAYPEAKNKTPILFSDIEDAVLNGDFDAGVIIHENRFTYEQKGLHKICDLGEIWEQRTRMPIPLGGIAVQRSIVEETKRKLGQIMRRSVEYAIQNPESSNDFVMKNALNTDVAVIEKHIHLYVNDFSVSLGKTGREAVQFLYKEAFELKMIEKIPEDIFI